VGNQNMQTNMTVYFGCAVQDINNWFLIKKQTNSKTY